MPDSSCCRYGTASGARLRSWISHPEHRSASLLMILPLADLSSMPFTNISTTCDLLVAGSVTFRYNGIIPVPDVVVGVSL